MWMRNHWRWNFVNILPLIYEAELRYCNYRIFSFYSQGQIFFQYWIFFLILRVMVLLFKQLLIFCILPAELKMDVLREREFKDTLERQLSDERKIRGKFFSSLFFYITIFPHELLKSVCRFNACWSHIKVTWRNGQTNVEHNG